MDHLFDKIIVLTIGRNKDRHCLVKKNLSGLDFQFWYGKDLTELYPGITHVPNIPADFFSENNISTKAWTMTRGQLGAYASIKDIIEYVANSDYSSALIFEDDFIPLKKDWRKYLNKAIKELPADWHILMLGYFYDGKIYKFNSKRIYRPIVRMINFLKKNKVVQPRRISKHLDKSGITNGGHAFCLSKKGAQHLMQFLNPMEICGDDLFRLLISENKLKSYSVYPCLFDQNKKMFPSKTESV